MKGRFHKLSAVLIALAFAIPTLALAAQAGELFGREDVRTWQKIPIGTVITPQNWQQYKEFMPEGMQRMFTIGGSWALPADFQIVVGPTHDYPLPKEFWDNTEKYSGNVRIETMPDGRHTVTGYTAGMPFPDPKPPMQGYKFLADTWYEWFPWIYCNNHSFAYLRDRFGNVTSLGTQFVYRQLSYISSVGQPIDDPHAGGVYYAEYTEVLLPEQSRYTTQLTLYYRDPLRSEDLFLFIPALRRSLRLSSAARCSPFVGTDFTQDDIKGGSFNGGLSRFDATYMGPKYILLLTTSDPAEFGNVSNYFTPLLFPKPVVAKWEVRKTHLLDVRRIPSQQEGYCLQKRMLYIDAQSFVSPWADKYDTAGRLWTTESFQQVANFIPREGKQLYGGDYIVSGIDWQNFHMTLFVSADPSGRHAAAGDACRDYEGVNYDNIERYSSVAGLSEILR